MHLIEFKSAFFFVFDTFKARFFSLQGQWPFSLLLPSMIVVSIDFINFLISHKRDHSFGSLLASEIKFKPSYFHHLAGGRVAGVHKKASLKNNANQTAIHHQYLVPKGRFERGSVPQMLRYIYPPPPHIGGC